MDFAATFSDHTDGEKSEKYSVSIVQLNSAISLSLHTQQYLTGTANTTILAVGCWPIRGSLIKSEGLQDHNKKEIILNHFNPFFKVDLGRVTDLEETSEPEPENPCSS